MDYSFVCRFYLPSHGAFMSHAPDWGIKNFGDFNSLGF